MKKTAIALIVILAALALAACGDSDEGDGGATATIGTEETEAPEEVEGGEDEAGGGGGSTVAIDAAPDGALAYTSEEASAEAGEVTVDFTNESAVGHDVDIENEAGETVLETDVITEGSTSASANLEPGEYTFYCSVPGHREAGMEGTLTVE